MPQTGGSKRDGRKHRSVQVTINTNWQCCAQTPTRRLNDAYDFCELHFTAFFVGPTDVRAGDVVWKVVAL